MTDICPRRLCPAETSRARCPRRERLSELRSDLSVVYAASAAARRPRARPGADRPQLRRFRRRRGRRVGGAGCPGRSGAPTGAVLGPSSARATVRGVHRAPQRPSRKPGCRSCTRAPARPVRPPARRAAIRRERGAARRGRRAGQPGGVWRKDPAFALGGRGALPAAGRLRRPVARAVDRAPAADRALRPRARSWSRPTTAASFEPGRPPRGHAANFEEIAGVPLLVKAPGPARGRIDDAERAQHRRAAHGRLAARRAAPVAGRRDARRPRRARRPVRAAGGGRRRRVAPVRRVRPPSRRSGRRAWREHFRLGAGACRCAARVSGRRPGRPALSGLELQASPRVASSSTAPRPALRRPARQDRSAA